VKDPLWDRHSCRGYRRWEWITFAVSLYTASLGHPVSDFDFFFLVEHALPCTNPIRTPQLKWFFSGRLELEAPPSSLVASKPNQCFTAITFGALCIRGGEKKQKRIEGGKGDPARARPDLARPSPHEASTARFLSGSCSSFGRSPFCSFPLNCGSSWPSAALGSLASQACRVGFFPAHLHAPLT